MKTIAVAAIKAENQGMWRLKVEGLIGITEIDEWRRMGFEMD